jgi:hypothetical protein
MQTIQLSVQDSVYNNLMQFLGTFKNDEIKVISNEQTIIKDARFLKHQKELQETIRRMDAGEAKYCTIEELEATLDKTIAKYEVKN